MDELVAAYARCRQIHRCHGRSYYLATRLLPRWKRRHVHALYGFTRYADEIVDDAREVDPAERADQLLAWSTRFLAGLGTAGFGTAGLGTAGTVGGTGAGECDDDLLVAVLHTIRVFDLDLRDFQVFLDSMAMDLTVTAYPTYQDLLGYMAGSAAAIGAMMLPILQAPARGPAVAGSAALGAARQLGLAFQLTNFIRDVAEDLDRGRVYLPMEDLDRFGVRVADLRVARAAGRSTRRIKDLIRYETRRARAHYAAAEIGIGLLEPSSRPCIRAAFTLYSGILDEVERGGDEVFAARAVVPAGRRLRLAAGALIHP